MKTMVDIADKVLQEALRHSGAATKREVVVQALEEYNRRHRLAEQLGTFEQFISRGELQELRQPPARTAHHGPR